MIFLRRLKWVEGQVIWLAEKMYRGETDTRMRVMEQRIEILERVVEFLKVTPTGLSPAPPWHPTDIPPSPESDTEDTEIEDDSLTLDHFPDDPMSPLLESLVAVGKEGKDAPN